MKYFGDFLLGNDGIENIRVQSDEELHAVQEEHEDVLELKRRRRMI